MRYKKLLFIIITSLLLISCGKESGSSTSSSETPIEPLTCSMPAKSHSGCCSSHGGIVSGMPDCPSGEVLYDAQDYVVCDDMEFRSSCTK